MFLYFKLIVYYLSVIYIKGVYDEWCVGANIKDYLPIIGTMKNNVKLEVGSQN